MTGSTSTSTRRASCGTYVNTYMAQLDQIFLNTPRQLLAAQATFMREDAKRIQNLPMGPASVNSTIGQLQADPNIVNLDGTPNPYYGRPYLKTTEPFFRDQPLQWDTTRAQLAYRLNLSRNEGWTKWLGTQQLLGYSEYKDQQSRQIRGATRRPRSAFRGSRHYTTPACPSPAARRPTPVIKSPRVMSAACMNSTTSAAQRAARSNTARAISRKT